MAQTLFDCKEWEVKGTSEESSEMETLCSLGEASYFISQNCQDLNCNLIERLKTEKLPHHTSIRLGAAICHTLKGEQEEVSFEGLERPEKRCYFSQDQTFISFNLLESWSGEGFKGPKSDIKLIKLSNR